MSILTIQRRLMEAGRIRIGEKDPERGYPKKLTTFRLTSRDRSKIDQAAGLWGGTVEPWDSPAGPQWQVTTDASALDVVVPPSEMAFSQFYELWSAGGCQRRCDGVTEQITEGPCVCDPDDRECSIHTRLSVMLRDLRGLGLWRIDTSGYYAAVELAGAVEIIAAAAGAGALLPARLRLEQRQVKRTGREGKPQTFNFVVPVLDIDVSPGQLIGEAITKGAVVAGSTFKPLDAGMAEREPKLLEPVPQSMEQTPVPSVAEQATTFPERKKRSNAAQPIPDTGVEPRTVDQVNDPEPPTVEPAGEDAIAELLAILGPDPKPSANMADLEAGLRKLYRLMEQAGIPKWETDAEGVDALHRALKVRAGASHVGDLKKAELVTFCQQSWEAARAAVKAHLERPFDDEEEYQ